MLLSRHTIVKILYASKISVAKKSHNSRNLEERKKKLLVYIAAESAHGSENSNTVIE
jgi:hypothetical protein